MWLVKKPMLLFAGFLFTIFTRTHFPFAVTTLARSLFVPKFGPLAVWRINSTSNPLFADKLLVYWGRSYGTKRRMVRNSERQFKIWPWWARFFFHFSREILRMRIQVKSPWPTIFAFYPVFFMPNAAKEGRSLIAPWGYLLPEYVAPVNQATLKTFLLQANRSLI